MADISNELNAIMAAIYGRDVRQSIHDGINEINEVSEVIFAVGATNPSHTPRYSNLLYLNTTNYDLYKSTTTKPYAWQKIGNIEGNAITSIDGPVTVGLVDTYTIHFTKAADVSFDVHNGNGIASIIGPTSLGLIDTYTINYTDGTTQTFDVHNGKGITRIDGPVTSGLVDTYTIIYNDGTSQDFDVTNGRDGIDGTTWLHGNEVNQMIAGSHGYILANDACKAGDLYFNNLQGAFYHCDVGAEAGSQSYWTFDIQVSGGGGGAVYLDDLLDVNAPNPDPNSYLQFNGTEWVPTTQSGSGHVMLPTPGASVDEEDVVTVVNAANGSNVNVASLFGVKKWSNKKTFRVIYESTQAHPIGHTGIGEWKDYLDNPTAADEASWGWWHHNLFTLLDNSDDLHTVANGYDVDIAFGFDPNGGEPITLGGYIVDTTTGYLCIKFANYVVDPSKAKIVVDITFTRNDVSTM